MDFVDQVCLSVLLVRRRRRKRVRRFWIHPIISERLHKGKFCLLHEQLKIYPEKFFEYYRMSIDSFTNLHFMIKPRLLKKATNMRQPISPEEKLAVTLR